jgi:hypothetical protein
VRVAEHAEPNDWLVKNLKWPWLTSIIISHLPGKFEENYEIFWPRHALFQQIFKRKLSQIKIRSFTH